MKTIIESCRNGFVSLFTMLFTVSLLLSSAGTGFAMTSIPTRQTSDLHITSQPQNGQVGVEVDSEFLIQFSESIKLANGDTLTASNAATIFQLQSSSDQSKVETQVKWSPKYKRLTIQPKTNLAYATKYVLTIPAGKVKTKAGIVNDWYRVEITTEEMLPPLSVSVFPKPNDNHVPIETNITITFNKDMVVANKKKKITDESIPTFMKLTDSKKKKIIFNGKWDEKSRTVILDPTGNLEPGNEHTVTLIKEKIQDNQGARNSEISFSFTTSVPTDSIAPSITSSPAHGSKDVPLTGLVILQFAEDVVLSTGESLSNKTVADLVTFEDRQGNKVNHYVTWNKSKRTITLRVKGKLSSFTGYVVKVPAGSVKDTAGNANKSFSVSFTTAGK